MAKRLYLFTRAEEQRKNEIFRRMANLTAKNNLPIFGIDDLTHNEIKKLLDGMTAEETAQLQQDAQFLFNIWRKPWFTIEYKIAPLQDNQSGISVNNIIDVYTKNGKEPYKAIYTYYTFNFENREDITTDTIKEDTETYGIIPLQDLISGTLKAATLNKVRSALKLTNYYFVYPSDRDKVIFVILTSGIPLDIAPAAGGISNNPYFTAMNHFQALDNFALIGTRKAEIATYPDKRTAKVGTGKGELKITTPLNGKNIGIQTDKLIRHSNGLIYKTGSPHIVFSLSEYMRKLNYPIDPDPTAADPIKEKKRAAAAYKDGKKKVVRELKTLYESSFSFKQGNNFYDHRFLTGKGISGDTVYMDFWPEYAKALKDSHVITQYSNALYGLDPQEDANAYRIGKKMCEHYNNETNLSAGRASRLKVETLLNVTDLPKATDENFIKNRLSWENRIKEPFDNALAKLKAKNVLDDYEYVLAKGEKLTDKEAENITSYALFCSLYVEFKLSNAPDHTEGIEHKKAAAKKRKSKKSGGTY